jgi:hypothetical protein
MNKKIYLTKFELIGAASEGWKKLGYTKGEFYKFKGSQEQRQELADCACFIGAAATGLSKSVDEIINLIPYGLVLKIAKISDEAGNKEDALRGIRVMEWTDG